MLDVFLTLAVSTMILGPTVEPIRCFRCTSLVQQECEYIYMFFTTYTYMEKEMQKECGPAYNACVSYIYGTDTHDSDGRKLQSYIQRDCANMPERHQCDSIESILVILNVTVFDKHNNCNVCNGSLCNSMPIEEGGRWLGGVATQHRPNVFSVAVTLITLGTLF